MSFKKKKKKKKKKKNVLDLDLRSHPHPHARTLESSPYVVPMLCCKHELFLIHSCQDIDTQNINIGNYCILYVLDFDLQPHLEFDAMEFRVSMIQTGIHSYKYLLRYELRDEITLCK